MSGVKKTVQLQKNIHEFRKIKEKKSTLLQKARSQLIDLRNISIQIEKTFPPSALKKIGEFLPELAKKRPVLVSKPMKSKRVEDVLSEKLAEIEERLNRL